MDAVEKLVKAGAQAVKLEGLDGHEEAIEPHNHPDDLGDGPYRPDAAVHT